MKHAVIAAAAAALIAGSAATYAANGQGGGPGFGPRWQPSAEDRAILADARIAEVKAGLKLTAEQEKLWPQVETALREASKNRSERMMAAREARRARRADKDAIADPITRMRGAADRMDATAADLRKIAEASEPLYKTLDNSQKHRLNILLRKDFFHGMKRGHGPRG